MSKKFKITSAQRKKIMQENGLLPSKSPHDAKSPNPYDNARKEFAKSWSKQKDKKTLQRVNLTPSPTIDEMLEKLHSVGCPFCSDYKKGRQNGYCDNVIKELKAALLAHDLALMPEERNSGAVIGSAGNDITDEVAIYEHGFNACRDLMAESLIKAYKGEK